MRVVLILISFLLCLICILVGLLQYYYMNYKRLISIQFDAPVFEDLIPFDNHAVGYSRLYWNKAEPLVNDFQIFIDCYFYNRVNDNSETVYTYDKAGDSEAYNSIHAALAFKVNGKFDKAKKLFEHAVAIAPNNPDILNFYGEFMEHTHKDVVTADELYTRVSVVCKLFECLDFSCVF